MADYVSKVIYDGETIIDLTHDTVTETALFKNYTAHAADGRKITGILELYVEDDPSIPKAQISYSNETLFLGIGNTASGSVDFKYS